MIPKIRHYVWVGSKPMPEKVLRNVASWRKRCPDYEVKLWNEKNFDVNSVPFTRDSCKRGKYGWPADYIRFWACCGSIGICPIRYFIVPHFFRSDGKEE